MISEKNQERIEELFNYCVENITDGNLNFILYKIDLYNHKNDIQDSDIQPSEDVLKQPTEKSIAYRFRILNERRKEEATVEISEKYVYLNGSNEDVRFDTDTMYTLYKDRLEEIYLLHEEIKANRTFESIIKIMGYERSRKINNLL